MANSAVAVQTAKDRAHILIVEDEKIIARDIQGTLEDLGYVITGQASTGAEALDLIAAAPTDLVLMDIRLRGEMDGIQTADHIREQFQVPVVYLTAHADNPTLNRAKTSEPFGYIVKPFTTADIKVGVEIALQRHRLQHQIEEREIWLTAVLRSAGDAIIVTDGSSRITFLNSMAEALLGLTAAEVTGRDLNAIVCLSADQDSLELLAVLNKMEGADEIHFTTGWLQRPDGSEGLIASSVGPIRKGPGGVMEGSVVLLRDISAFRRTERSLRESNEFLTRSNENLTALSHSLTHDLSEPLRAVTCYSQILAGENSLAGPQQEYLQHITEGCNRMQHLLSSLLNYYRAGVVEDVPAAPVNASHALEEALSNLRAAVQTSGASIHVKALPEVYAHPTALIQIFQNLIGNAIKYSRAEIAPRVEISSEREDAFWQFAVADNGSGFDPSQAEQIFTLFMRGHGREQAGSGVGLALCRRLVEQYGGKIWAESAPGKGAQFYFTLPAERRYFQ